MPEFDISTGEALGDLDTALLEKRLQMIQMENAVRELSHTIEVFGSGVAIQRERAKEMLRMAFPDLAGDENDLADMRKKYEIMKLQIKALATDISEETGERSFAGGIVNISMVDRWSVDELAALDWCIEVRPDMLRQSVDITRLKRLVREGRGAIPPAEIISFSEGPQASFHEAKTAK